MRTFTCTEFGTDFDGGHDFDFPLDATFTCADDTEFDGDFTATLYCGTRLTFEDDGNGDFYGNDGTSLFRFSLD